MTGTDQMQRAEDYHAMSAQLRSRSDDLLRRLGEIGPNSRPAVRRLLLGRLDEVLTQQRRLEWEMQQRQGGF